MTKSATSESAPAAARTPSARRLNIPTSIADVCKRTFLGKPLITEQLESEKLSNPVALGALSPDAISSTAYGPEQIVVELLPYAGMAAFMLMLPITAVILVILLLVTASYRQVIMTYARAGGSYLVARENFGPRVAQIAAAALLIDYVVTVAVQPAAGTLAVVSALPQLRPYSLEITIGAVLLICYANLRGVQQAGRAFAAATYAFVIMMTAMILTGVGRDLMGSLPTYPYDPQNLPGAVPVHHGSGLVMGATILVLLRAFAHGGTSLTGVEAISNTVNIFRKPQGLNARRVLTLMACMLGFLLAGVSYLAYRTHVTPFVAEYPSLLSEIGHTVFGGGPLGNTLYFLLQASSAAILFTGCNTSYGGFPPLASFVAEDRFLPRPLTKRGHRLVFSNGIITLTALAVGLLLVTGGSVRALVPMYAIGVFSAFAMAGYGMTKHHLTHRGARWRFKLLINLATGITSTIVVGIFVVVKFTEGAWLIALVFPLLVFALMRLNRSYRAEATVLEGSRRQPTQVGTATHHQVFVFVDSVDLAEIEALRYGKGLRADNLIAVHFVIDTAHAEELQESWKRFDGDAKLRVINCPDRHLGRAAQQLVLQTLGAQPDTRVTVLLPRRTFAPLVGRLLHDATADKIAQAVSRVAGATALIVPYDIESRIARAIPGNVERQIPGAGRTTAELT